MIIKIQYGNVNLPTCEEGKVINIMVADGGVSGKASSCNPPTHTALLTMHLY